ncbi:MAG: lyase family protein [Solirubrobacteraceae bacterium]
MTSEPVLFAGVYARGEIVSELTDEAWLQAMLDVEAALARACGQAGLIGLESAERIAAACVARDFDVVALGRQAAHHATPVVGLVAALRNAVGEPYAADVHLGATSQDILDTALMLVARRALMPLLADLSRAAGAAGALADMHRHTSMVGRTLLQQALPTTFGLRAATWLVGLDAARRQLKQLRDAELAVQMGGPVGARSPAVAALVATQLGLAEPVLPWHTVRMPPAALATALGTLAGVLSKIARDATLLAQQEVGEATEHAEAGRGGSTAMAHKHNPVAAVSTLACSKRVPGLVATALACMEQEHERAAGAWQAEWGTYAELLGLTGAAAAWCRELLESLDVDAERMQANLDRLAASGAAARLDDEQLAACDELIDRALAAHRR